MRISRVGAVHRVIAYRVSPVQLRLDAIRQGLRKYGAVMVNPSDKVDAEAISRLKRQFGEDNVRIERSKNAKLTVSNFKR